MKDRREMARGSRKRMLLQYFVILLLLLNMLLLLALQTQMKSINGALNQVLSSLPVGQNRAGKEYYAASSSPAPENTQRTSTVEILSLNRTIEVEKPVKRTEEEVLVRLKELSEDDEMIAGIYRNSAAYPEKMLEALANNPEMAEFAAGYLTSEKKAAKEGLTESEKEQDFPLFLQWDSRWGYVEYGDDSNIGLAGCGPVCLSMMLYYLLRDEEGIMPDKIAAYSMENGYYMSGTGTAWALLTDVPQLYGIDVRQPGSTEWAMKNALDQGRIIICSMGPGDFTAAGHFIVIYGYDEEGFLVNDPNCLARSNEKWTYKQIGGQIKNVWTYGKGEDGIVYVRGQ